MDASSWSESSRSEFPITEMQNLMDRVDLMNEHEYEARASFELGRDACYIYYICMLWYMYVIRIIGGRIFGIRRSTVMVSVIDGLGGSVLADVTDCDFIDLGHSGFFQRLWERER